MAKIILITGAGRGKSLIGNLLAEMYEREGVSCDRIFVTHPADIAAADESKAEYVIVESNYITEIPDAWQVIQVSGGMPVEG